MKKTIVSVWCLLFMGWANAQNVDAILGYTPVKPYHYGDEVAEYLQQYGLSDSSAPLFLVALQGGACEVSCYAPLNKLHHTLVQKGAANIVYLLAGVYDYEKELFFEEKINMPLEGKRVILDNDFYKVLLPERNNQLVVLQAGKMVYRRPTGQFHYTDDFTFIHDLTGNAHMLNAVDTVRLKYEKIPFLRPLDIGLSGNAIYVLDGRYNALGKFDLRSGSLLESLSAKEILAHYPITDLYRIALHDRPAILSYAVRFYEEDTTNLIEGFGVSLLDVAVNEKGIYASLSVRFAEAFKTDDMADTLSTIVSLVFLLELDEQLGIKNIYYLPYEIAELSNYSTWNSGFYVTSEKEAFIRIEPKRILEIYRDKGKVPIGEGKYPYWALYELSDNRASYKGLSIDVMYPDFLFERNIVYDYYRDNWHTHGKDIYFYYSHYPEVYNMTTGKSFLLPETNYKNMDRRSGKTEFVLSDFWITPKGNKAAIIIEDDKPYFVLYDKDVSKVVSRSTIDSPVPVWFSVQQGNRFYVFVSEIEQGRSYLLRYDYSED